MVIELQRKIQNIEESETQSYHIPIQDSNYINKLEHSIKKYEQLLDEYTIEKLDLLNQVTHLEKINHEMKRVNYRNSDNNETEYLIEELTAKLQ